ncbi:alpha/beta hydrolase [Phenylobacterium sp. 20VBR1]|uniref:Alpha/beta hydrolase n=2 Tax=Phenylobacterium glaciei TaxID=2803784 RepID=A0A941HXL9_9CAUL|nr:alpha/beta hydrolase [Phenylobacterium glaciei]MBR7620580.1 alpha/beta hydrolase [Phenylobacterium glaciei]
MNRVDRRLVLGAGALLGAGLATKGFAAETATTGYAKVDGLKVYYEVHGGPLAGLPPFVLLHGGMMTIETAFPDGFLARLARVRPLIAIEQQGHGHTADRESAPSLDRMSADTAGVLAHLGVKQAHFVGHSLGGMVAMNMAVRRPDLARTVSAISISYTLDGYQPELVKLQRGEIQQPSPELTALLPTEADFASWQASYRRTAPDPTAFDRVLTKTNAMLSAWTGWSPEQLRAVKTPTLLAIGDNDFVRIDHAAEMARLIPGAQLAVLPNTTHLNILTRGAWLEPMIAARIGDA